MPQPLTTGSILTCNQGAAPCVFITSPRPASLRVLSALESATIDQITVANIPTFGMCKSMANPSVASATAAAQGVLTPMPCVPTVVSPWAPPAALTKSVGVPLATVSSRCNCAFGGSISAAPSAPPLVQSK